MLVCVRWSAGYPLSFRQIEETMAERGVFVDHSTLHRWSMKMLPVLAAAFCRRKRPVSRGWRMDEPYVKVGGQWKYLNNIVEQDHRAIKRITRPMLGFETLRCARILIAGIETMHMTRKGQLGNNKDKDSSAASQFYSLAF
jgi:transposase-like protein